jgi:hypothetical protein
MEYGPDPSAMLENDEYERPFNVVEGVEESKGDAEPEELEELEELDELETEKKVFATIADFRKIVSQVNVPGQDGNFRVIGEVAERLEDEETRSIIRGLFEPDEWGRARSNMKSFSGLVVKFRDWVVNQIDFLICLDRLHKSQTEPSAQQIKHLSRFNCMVLDDFVPAIRDLKQTLEETPVTELVEEVVERLARIHSELSLLQTLLEPAVNESRENKNDARSWVRTLAWNTAESSLTTLIAGYNKFIVMDETDQRLSWSALEANNPLGDRVKGILAYFFKPVTSDNTRNIGECLDSVWGLFTSAREPAYADFCVVPEGEGYRINRQLAYQYHTAGVVNLIMTPLKLLGVDSTTVTGAGVIMGISMLSNYYNVPGRAQTYLWKRLKALSIPEWWLRYKIDKTSRAATTGYNCSTRHVCVATSTQNPQYSTIADCVYGGCEEKVLVGGHGRGYSYAGGWVGIRVV